MPLKRIFMPDSLKLIRVMLRRLSIPVNNRRIEFAPERAMPVVLLPAVSAGRVALTEGAE
jgi:hypothetical protein